MFGTLAANGNKSISTKEDIYFEITDLTGYDLVVSYKINDSEDDDRVKALFDKTTGFWKVERQKLALNPGDTFEVTIARFHRINISVRDYANNSKLYEGNELTLKVSKTAGEGRLFPKFSDADGAPLEIKKNMIENSNKYCTVYVPKDVTLQFDMEGLDEGGKEIGEWNGALSLVNDINTFNDESNNPDLRIGKTSDIQHTFNSSYQNDAYTLNACIRDKTAVLTVKLLECVNGAEGEKTDDNNIAVGITPTGLPHSNLHGDQGEYKKRINVGNKVELVASRNSASDYYFAYWKEGSDENYAMSKEFNMPDKNCDIKAYWSKTFIVKMHKMLQEDLNAWDDQIPKSRTKVELFRSNGTVITPTSTGHSDVNRLQNNEEGTLIPVYASTTKDEEKLIKNIPKIQLQFEVSAFTGLNGVVYRYTFGDKNGQTNNTIQEGNSRGLIKINKAILNSAVLHVWLKHAGKY